MYQVVVLLPNKHPHVSKPLDSEAVCYYGSRMKQIYPKSRIAIRNYVEE